MAVATQAREDRIEDVSLGKVVLRSSKKGLNTGIGDVITAARLEEATKGATEMILELIDRDYAALKSGLFSTRVRCAIDGAGFRLAELSLLDDFHLSATFEHELIAEMRENTKPKKATRGSVTRAEFILSMLRELKLPFRFICPELHRSQPTAPAEEVQETHSDEAEEQKTATLKSSGRGASSDHLSGLTAKHQQITQGQAAILTEALGAAEVLGAPKLAMEALVVALIQENDISNASNNSADLGALSLIESTAHGIQKQDGSGTIDPFDVAEVSTHFLVAGFAGAGGAIALAKAHPDWSPSKIGSAVQGPRNEYPSSWNDEARKIVEHFTGASGSAESPSSTTTTVRTARYEFTRGQPEQVEDTFSCCQRLAEEVGWSFFVVGKRDVYFVNDNDLLRAKPRYVVEPDSPGVQKLTFDVEVGNRTTIQHGKRRLKPSEAVLMARVDRNEAPPGTVIVLKGWGIADGKWLVDHVERGVFDAETTIQLRTPQKPLEEPRAETSTEPTTKEGGKRGKRVAEAAEREVGTPYKWGGEEPGVSFDCSGLVQWATRTAGVSLPRTAQEQFNATKRITSSDAQEGDLVFFGSGPTDVSHVGIVINSGTMVDAPHTGADVRIENFPPEIGGHWGSDVVVGYGRY